MSWKGSSIAAGGWAFAALAICLSAGAPYRLTVAGYGIYVHYSWPLLLLIVTGAGLAVAAWTKTRARRRAWIVQLSVVVLIDLAFLGGWQVGDRHRRKERYGICTRCEPLIAALEEYKAEHGRYPSGLKRIPATRDALAASGVHIIEKKFGPRGLDVSETDEVDAVLYLAWDKYLLLVPVDKKFLISITRFHAYLRGSQDAEWVYDHLIWMIGGIGSGSAG